jgi:tetratricopeptide (TPR) repeat protein
LFQPQTKWRRYSQQRRRALHARIVESLEAFAGDRVAESVERLAYHALRGEVWEQAVAYCRQAGEKAMARSASHEAAEYCEQALSALQHLPERRGTREQAIDLQLALLSALRPLGDYGRMLAALRERESLAAALDDPRRLGQVSVFLANHLYTMGTYDRAIAPAQRAMALATAGGDVGLYARANDHLGTAYRARGGYRRAIECFRLTVASLESMPCPERFGDVVLYSVASRASLAWCHAELGMFDEGIAPGQEGLRIAAEVEHPLSLMSAHYTIGLLALFRGDVPRALPLLERAVSRCRKADRPAHFRRMAAALGAAYTLGGRVADALPQPQARPELLAAITLYRAMEMSFWLPRTEVALAQAEGR